MHLKQMVHVAVLVLSTGTVLIAICCLKKICDASYVIKHDLFVSNLCLTNAIDDRFLTIGILLEFFY